jgi:outer membrane receptor protein involved in Fe transport
MISALLVPQRKPGGERQMGGTVKGIVVDASSGNPIEYANILLFGASDSSMVNGTITNPDGSFLIEKIRSGKYYFEVKFMGYNNWRTEFEISRNSREHDLGEIKLEPVAVNLGDVLVEGERSSVSYQVDKKVIDVSQIQTVISGNATDVLENVPSVTVDIEGNVSLRGSGNFSVLVDGRPSILDPQESLQQIAASTIKSIEIITNPSAKYDPEGTAGIINVILKQSKNEGIAGITNLNAGLNEKYGGDFLGEYKNSSVRYYFGLDFNRRNMPGNSLEENIYFYENNTSFSNSNADVKRGRTSYGLRGGIEFILDEANILTFGGRYGYREGERSSKKNYTEWNSMDPGEFIYLSNSDRSRSGPYFSLNSNYTHKFNSDNGHQLMSELYFRHRNSDEETLTSDLSERIQINGRKTTEKGPSSQFRGKIDYMLPFNEFNKIEAGYQGEISESEDDNGFYEYNPELNEYENQPLFSNMNNYNRIEHAFYSMYADKIFNFLIQGGLRTEYTYRLIEVPSNSAKFEINRWDFFPSVHTSYNFASGMQLMGSYSRRIERPRGWALEPFDTWIDGNNVRRGNPDLQPEFIDSYEAGLQTYFGNVSISTELYYRITHNKTERVRSVFAENVTLTTFQNVGTDYSLGGEFLLNFNLIDFWNINLMGNIYHYKVEGILYERDFSQTSFNWNTRFNNMFSFGKLTQLQLNLRYSSPTVTSQGEREGYFSTDISVKQELIENTLAATLQVRDIFGTAKYEYTSTGRDFSTYTYSTRESPVVMLNLRYTFNNYKPQRERTRENGGFDEGDDF